MPLCEVEDAMIVSSSASCRPAKGVIERMYGLRLSECECVWLVWAPNAKEVASGADGEGDIE
jgi:hypothetical protein